MKTSISIENRGILGSDFMYERCKIKLALQTRQGRRLRSHTRFPILSEGHEESCDRFVEGGYFRSPARPLSPLTRKLQSTQSSQLNHCDTYGHPSAYPCASCMLLRTVAKREQFWCALRRVRPNWACGSASIWR